MDVGRRCPGTVNRQSSKDRRFTGEKKTKKVNRRTMQRPKGGAERARGEEKTKFALGEKNKKTKEKSKGERWKKEGEQKAPICKGKKSRGSLGGEGGRKLGVLGRGKGSKNPRAGEVQGGVYLGRQRKGGLHGRDAEKETRLRDAKDRLETGRIQKRLGSGEKSETNGKR